MFGHLRSGNMCGQHVRALKVGHLRSDMFGQLRSDNMFGHFRSDNMFGHSRSDT